jgi:pyruvate formate lyase activating enzyme
MKKALFFSEEKCTLCPHICSISEGKTGLCGVRKNILGELYSLVYGKPIGISIDPIEKKPLYHFYPGKKILSLGTVGCNLTCLYCQNHSTSFASPDSNEKGNIIIPEKIIDLCKDYGTDMIAFTYNEPTVFFEYMLEIAQLAKKEGFKTVIVTNGYTSMGALQMLLPYIDAANIDLKAFSDNFYKDFCGGRLFSVLDSIKYYVHEGIWVELTNLIIPGLNDSEKDIRKLCSWVVSHCGSDLPVHFSAFHGMHKMKKRESTRFSTLLTARKVAHSEGLSYVYLGNIPEKIGGITYCGACGKEVIIRNRNIIQEGFLGICSCGKKIPGRWV